MSSIDHFDLRAFDLNLLVAFDALMEDRTVTRAAARLKVQQPAMSHSLATLRMLLQDELFVRVGQTMQPTAKARLLAPRIRFALHQMQAAIRTDEAFAPETLSRTFRLGFSNELELLVLPDLSARLRGLAPGVRLLARIAGHEQVHALLDDARIDLAIGCFDHSAARHCGRHLFDQELACCFHPGQFGSLTPPLDLTTYLETPHALLTLGESLQGCLEVSLDRLGARLNVVAAASEFLSVLAIAATAPVLATLPARMARRYGPLFGLTVSPVPLDLALPPVAMVWPAQLDRDPAAAWLREQIPTVLAEPAPQCTDSPPTACDQAVAPARAVA